MSGSGPASFDQLLATAERNLSRLQPGMPAEFRFRWQDIAFQGRVDEDRGNARLRLLGDLGPLPFTAESPEQRLRLLTLARLVIERRTGERAACRFAISRHQHLNLVGETTLAGPVTGAAIVVSTTALLLRSRPYIDLAREEQNVSAGPHRDVAGTA